MRELTIETNGEVRVLRARVTDLPSLLMRTPAATLRTGGLEIEWSTAGVRVLGDGPLAGSIREMLFEKNPK